MFKKLPPGTTPEQFEWSGTTLIEATKVQNIFAYHELAPRVYAIALINGERLAQVTRYAEGNWNPRPIQALKIARHYQIGAKGHPIGPYLAREAKWIGDQMVDFGEMYFRDKSEYENRLRRHVIRYHKKPHSEDIGYQDCEELGIMGRRRMDYRRRIMKLDSVDFTGKTVLDIGCNNGAFCREAARRGAARVVGVDHKYVKGNRELANWLGYWNIDFTEARLPFEWGRIRQKNGIERFDIVFCLAIAGHIGGYASWMADLCGGLMYFSGQSVEPRSKYQDKLEADFARVERLGYERDEPHRRHPLWRCWK